MPKIRRIGYRLLGLLSLGTGLLGLFVPLLPTTVFILIAAWAFSRSSDRWHARLLAHPRFGPTIQAWQAHRAIPPRAKRWALLGLGLSLLVSAATLPGHPWLLALITTLLGAVALYILSRPDGGDLPASCGRC